MIKKLVCLKINAPVIEFWAPKWDHSTRLARRTRENKLNKLNCLSCWCPRACDRGSNFNNNFIITLSFLIDGTILYVFYQPCIVKRKTRLPVLLSTLKFTMSFIYVVLKTIKKYLQINGRIIGCTTQLTRLNNKSCLWRICM